VGTGEKNPKMGFIVILRRGGVREFRKEGERIGGGKTGQKKKVKNGEYTRENQK